MIIRIGVAAVVSLVLASCGGERQQNAAQQAPPDQAKTASALITDAKDNLAKAKSQLAQDGKYDCCLKDDCTMCALETDSCGCAKAVKAGKDVCVECYRGWHEGLGDVPNIDPKTVRTAAVEVSH